MSEPCPYCGDRLLWCWPSSMLPYRFGGQRWQCGTYQEGVSIIQSAYCKERQGVMSDSAKPWDKLRTEKPPMQPGEWTTSTGKRVRFEEVQMGFEVQVYVDGIVLSKTSMGRETLLELGEFLTQLGLQTPKDH